MDWGQLRQRCDAVVRGLDLPKPFDLRVFSDSIAAKRGRQIVLHPMIGRSGVWGLWAAGSTADHIFFEKEPSPIHQEHIVVHELSHLLCNHQSAPLAASELARLMFPNLASETIRKVLARSSYSTEEEQEAELLSSLILASAYRKKSVSNGPADVESATFLANLEATLQNRGPRI